MRKTSLLLVVLTLGLGVLSFTPSSAGAIGPFTDAQGDTFDPTIAQNQAIKDSGAADANIPVADILSWSAHFNGAIDKIIFKMKINARIPRPSDVSPTPNPEAPPGYVGASYRLMFTSSAASVSQTTGKNCASFSDGHANQAGHPWASHQNVNYSQCTDTREGAYKGPNFKHFIDYGWREGLNSAGQFENEGTVAWGLFDTYNQSLTFHDVEVEMPCATASGFVLGGGTCPWSVQIADTDPSAAVKDELTLTMPYNPTWVLGDDLDDNALFDDEARNYKLVQDNSTITGIVGTAWVDQVVGLPEPLCDPTDPACTGDGDPTACDPDDVGCITAETNEVVSEAQSYVANRNDCTPPNNGNQRASCIQEIGGFVYVVDWNSDNAYDMGLFGWPVPGYIASPSCRYQAAVPFLTSGRMPDGVAIYSDPTRSSGYTGVILPYGLRVHGEEFPEPPDNNPYDNANAPWPGYQNVFVPGAPTTTVDNPLPNVLLANPLLNDATCSYTPFVGAKFVEGNGKSTTGT